MKKVKKTALISILFTTFASMFLMISGCGKKYQEIALYKYIENTDGTLTITELTDKGRSEYELTVPAMLDGKKVLAIGDGAFRDDTFIKKVVIEDGIESIGSNAFLSCYNLADIDIPAGSTYGEGCIEVLGKAKIVGIQCAKNMGFLLKSGIMKEVVLK